MHPQQSPIKNQQKLQSSEELQIKNLKRSLTNKNRQICTLNRIINNIRKQLDEINGALHTKDDVIQGLKKNINELKETIRNKQLKEIQILRKEQELIEKLFRANEQLQRREEENQKQIKKQKSENEIKFKYLEDLKEKCEELERENQRLGVEIELKSQAECRIRESRQSKLSSRQMSLQAFNYKPLTNKNRAYQNPFQGFLKPHSDQIFLHLSRLTHRSENKGVDNTWCRIDELMSQNCYPEQSKSQIKKINAYPQYKLFDNKSQFDAERAIQMIRQESERIKVSL